ncbi:MAG: diaminopimelate epimerase [Acidimicrobiia bacterium]
MEFVKMEGLGNDFVVLTGPREVSAEQAARWCHRRRGVGADGVLVVTPLRPDRIRMEYWNADGSGAETCGNGLRCVARLAADRGWVGSSFVVETAAGDRPVTVGEDGLVRALMGTPSWPERPAEEVAGVMVHPARIGNPHAVVLVDDPAQAPLAELGPAIAGDPLFPDGANVEFLAVRSPQLLELRVWERGVGETPACGSGAAVAAAVASRLGQADRHLTVRLPGGELYVEVEEEGVWITGPARYVFEGRWEADE